MFCPKCGHEASEDAGFCGGCGTPLKKPGVSAAKSVPDQTAAGTPSALPDKLGGILRSPVKLGIAAAAVVVVLVGAFLVLPNVTGAYTLGQTNATFRAAFEDTPYAQEGVASNEYVAESPYSLVAFNATDITKVSENLVTANATATIENESFSTTYDLRVEYRPHASGSSAHGLSNYQFSVLSEETKPLKGIDKDDKRGLEGIEAVLSEDGTNCEVILSEEFDYWFAGGSIDSVYRYTFSGNQWSFDGEDKQANVVYKDIDGAYAAKAGDLTRISAFQISDLDPDKGTFKISCNIDSYKSPGFLIMYTYAEAACSLEAAIEPKQGGTYALDDGMTYEFHASGTSTAGEKTAEMTGHFTVREDGAAAIDITGMKISMEYTIGGGSPSNEQFVSTGTLFKQ